MHPYYITLIIFLLPFFGESQPLVRGKYLEKDSVIRDINLLEQALTEIHPGYYRYQTEADLAIAFDNLRDQLPDPVSEAELMKRMAQTTALIRCGHTYLNPWNMQEDLRSRLFDHPIYLPLCFRVLDGDLIVTRSVSEAGPIQRGARIRSINGIPVPDILDSLRTIARYDGSNDAPVDHYLSLSVMDPGSYEAFDLYFPLFFPMSKPEFRLEYQAFEKKEIQTTVIPAMDKQERADAMARRYPAFPRDSVSWEVDISDPKAAYLQLGTFVTWHWEGFQPAEWLASAFAKINNSGAENLILDIRGNAGGLTDIGFELISYLTPDPIPCSGKGKTLIRTHKISEELAPYADTWVDIIFEGLPERMYSRYNDYWLELKEPGGCRTIEPKENRFRGEVYILGDASNVSATFTLLQYAKKNGFATYVGEASGGNLQGINGGEYIFFRLPYTNMEVDLPLKYFYPGEERPDAGVEPDVEVRWTREDVARGRDPQLAWVLEKL